MENAMLDEFIGFGSKTRRCSRLFHEALLSIDAFVVLSDFSYANALPVWHILTPVNSQNCHHGNNNDMTDFAPAVSKSFACFA
jgi:hypothetical protein